tara:strand:+ start:718 stop:873 length:156 start_codon:yes stop_codon:yes gene_type:complete
MKDEKKDSDSVPEDEDFTAKGIDERERVSRFMKHIAKLDAQLAEALRVEAE